MAWVMTMPDPPKDDRDFHARNADLYAEVHALRRMLMVIVQSLAPAQVIVTKAALDEMDGTYRLDVTEAIDCTWLRVEKLQ